MRPLDLPKLSPGVLSRIASPRLVRARRPKPSRFVMQSHALSRPIANPKALLIAAAIAIALYLVGHRLSD